MKNQKNANGVMAHKGDKSENHKQMPGKQAEETKFGKSSEREQGKNKETTSEKSFDKKNISDRNNIDYKSNK